jgi:hypothetical protein
MGVGLVVVHVSMASVRDEEKGYAFISHAGDPPEVIDAVRGGERNPFR